MRCLTLLTIGLALAGVAPSTALSHNSGYAFPERAIRARASALRYVFNQLFPNFAPHEVRCWGLNPKRLSNGTRGYAHIRCRIESMDVPDFIYHWDSRGELVTTRAWG